MICYAFPCDIVIFRGSVRSVQNTDVIALEECDATSHNILLLRLALCRLKWRRSVCCISSNKTSQAACMIFYKIAVIDFERTLVDFETAIVLYGVSVLGGIFFTRLDMKD